jgi:hypothetical protein
MRKVTGAAILALFLVALMPPSVTAQLQLHCTNCGTWTPCNQACYLWAEEGYQWWTTCMYGGSDCHPNPPACENICGAELPCEQGCWNPSTLEGTDCWAYTSGQCTMDSGDGLMSLWND